MTINKCFAIDYSGSTWNDTFYHNNVLKILNLKFEKGDEIIIWDNNSRYVTWDEYMRINREKDGNGGTYPKCLFNSVFSKHPKATYSEFILISDGEIDNRDVEDLDRIIRENIDNFKCNSTEVYLFGKYANLSVACPFTRLNKSKTIVKKPNGDDQIIDVSDEDLKTIDEIDSINTLAEFNLKFDSLQKAFIARFLGTDGDKELRKSVLLMHKRINADNAKRSENTNEKINNLVMQEKNYDEAKKEVLSCFSSVLGGDFQSRINSLIRMCDGGLKQVFDINALQTFRAYTSSNIEENEVENIQDLNIESSVNNSQWECPISIDNEIDPMILITVDDENQKFTPALIGFDKSVTEKMLDCPLNALYFNEFIEKFKAFIDHPISLKNYRASLQSSNPIEKSPFTRRTIIGAIPLGENEEHVNAANWSLMKIITGGKNLGDKNLWFFVLYMLIKRNQIPYLKDIEPFIEAQVKYRLSHYTTSISLSGLSNLPQTRVLYPTAAWTCLISPFLIPKIPSNLNLLFTHLGHYRELLHILDLFDIKLPKEFQPMANRVEILAYLLTYFKRNPKQLTLYKNGLRHSSILIHVDENSDMASGGLCGDLFIPIDGEMDDAVRMQCVQKLSNKCYSAVQEGKITLDELAWLIDFVDVQKNLTDIDILPFIQGRTTENGSSSNVNDFWKEWDANINRFNVKISENTCRPYYYVGPGITWLDELSTILDTSRPILSLDKNFGNFVDSYRRYPNHDEYILYLYRRICLGSKTSSTLPQNIRKFANQVFARFEPIMKKYTPEMFIQIFQDNASITERIKNE
ncbi:hypothetical protein PIROE2DRAFT_69440 [Piromyces sp. E2]|nr:hypothetical protein PIROE2DRAFT_69440 [Piromyces sp. E2]|eukprot:OUM62865.1 hypothetical protein PIROE2DRAFT_69440 [Piromyces sp. E2]